MLTSPNDMDCRYSPKINEASGVEAQQVPLAPPEEDLHATLGAAIHAIKLHACSMDTESHSLRLHLTSIRLPHHVASHNHEIIHPSAFAQFRRPNEEEKALIRSLHASGSAPRFIIAALVELNPECLMSLLDVYNEVARIQKERLGSLSPIEALII
ncbi:hypothetical protein PsorP6_008749 [Peronosclerospora sorghi]|uniref:Uncharacterized protein n=1 Tax=Peronosclerospora sorghi TaxID=230839 RepID=A0ACC0VXI1_9STRA|nr:hypothetical protein PsorP6_008749 [Peronosclerospora sorghi]